MATSSLRHGVTIIGAVLLVTGTLCFAWWSDGEMVATSTTTTSSSDQKVPPHEEAGIGASSYSSKAVLKSISFFCCGIGGFLLIFGLLWSANAGLVSRQYRYHFPRDLHYSTVEPLEKQTCSTWEASTIPTYEEALNCWPADNVPHHPQATVLKENRLPLYQLVETSDTRHGGRRRSSSDSILFRNIPPRLDSRTWNEGSDVCDTPPPSYESIGSHVG